MTRPLLILLFIKGPQSSGLLTLIYRYWAWASPPWEIRGFAKVKQAMTRSNSEVSLLTAGPFFVLVHSEAVQILLPRVSQVDLPCYSFLSNVWTYVSLAGNHRAEKGRVPAAEWRGLCQILPGWAYTALSVPDGKYFKRSFLCAWRPPSLLRSKKKDWRGVWAGAQEGSEGEEQGGELVNRVELWDLWCLFWKWGAQHHGGGKHLLCSGY